MLFVGWKTLYVVLYSFRSSGLSFFLFIGLWFSQNDAGKSNDIHTSTVPHLAVMSTFDEIWKAVTTLRYVNVHCCSISDDQKGRFFNNTEIETLSTGNSKRLLRSIVYLQFPVERVSLCSLQIIALGLVSQFRYCYKICPCFSDFFFCPIGFSSAFIKMYVKLMGCKVLIITTIIIYVWSRNPTCTPGYHHDGFIATPEFVHREYGYTLLVSKNQRVLKLPQEKWA